MFGIGTTEFLVIIVVAILVLGPEHLPRITRTVAKVMSDFRRVSTEFQRTMNLEANKEDWKREQEETAKKTRKKKKKTAGADSDDDGQSPKPKKKKKSAKKADAPGADAAGAKTPESGSATVAVDPKQAPPAADVKNSGDSGKDEA